MRDHLQFSLLLLTEFKGINLLLFPLKSSENLLFFDDFWGNRIADDYAFKGSHKKFDK